MSLADTLRKDSAALLDAITSADAGLTVRELTTATGLKHGRAREALAYLLGAGSVSCAEEAERGGAVQGKRTPALVWRVAKAPKFNHVYAAIEDSLDELDELWPRLPRGRRGSVEYCQVWLGRALALIDGAERP